jgi:Leucine-rich repeat (LRR) protein
MDSFTNVHEAIAHVDTALELILTDRNLHTLPKEIAQLVNLEVLNISINELRKLPSWLFDLKKLRVLDISCTSMDDIPDAIGDLLALEELILGGFDGFTHLPETLGKLTRLRKLDLTDANSLLSLPECLSSMPSIEELHLVRTSALVNVNDAINKLPKLRKLVIDDISLTSLATKPELWNGMQSLTLARTEITHLPDWIGSLQLLEELYIDNNNNLTAIPPEIGNLMSLKVLDIELYKPLTIPNSLGKLIQLERLVLTRFGFTAIPKWIFDLSSLKSLSLGLNPIEYVSYDLSSLQKLEKLYFGYNPRLASQREQIETWLPNCAIVLTPAAAKATASPLEQSIAMENPTSHNITNLTFKTSRNSSGPLTWPELGSIEMWAALDSMKKTEVSQALAKAMGPHVYALKPTSKQYLPRLKETNSGLVFIAIAGGSFSMGLNNSEKKELIKLTKKWSEESQMHVKDLQNFASPSHEVSVPAFLCLEMPITPSQGIETIPALQTTGDICLFDPFTAVCYAKRSGARLLSEAEWEYVARQGVSKSWLTINEHPITHNLPKYFKDTLAKGGLGGEGDMFGLRGLGWGTWVEDGWHDSYAGAPIDGSAWEPKELPEMIRSGAFLSWPWQMDGEALLLHVAHREHQVNRNFPILLARDLPVNR